MSVEIECKSTATYDWLATSEWVPDANGGSVAQSRPQVDRNSNDLVGQRASGANERAGRVEGYHYASRFVQTLWSAFGDVIVATIYFS